MRNPSGLPRMTSTYAVTFVRSTSVRAFSPRCGVRSYDISGMGMCVTMKGRESQNTMHTDAVTASAIIVRLTILEDFLVFASFI